ncbi:MAG: CSLREA domain-containing protein [Dehalococcoidia bacterium]|nr:CSLREA domain-containing protein [Dehalococcoidia bacterium]
MKTGHLVVLAALAALAALFALPTSPALGATFTVDSTADAVDDAPGNGVCATAGAVCTLRAAVQETNALPRNRHHRRPRRGRRHRRRARPLPHPHPDP